MAADASLARRAWRRPVGLALLTTAVVAVLSYVLPDEYAASGVGLTFLLATYVFALRTDDADSARRHGLSLGGLFDPEPIAPKRLVRAMMTETAFALAVALVVFPPFWAAWMWWWSPRAHFHPASLSVLVGDALGQFLVIALPEEAFYRGYLQTTLDDVWQPRWSILGARVGPALIVTSAIFALGHVVTEFHPSRLGVFFPSLLFGVIRSRRGSAGTSAVFHALCNLFAAWLARSYGLL